LKFIAVTFFGAVALAGGVCLICLAGSSLGSAFDFGAAGATDLALGGCFGFDTAFGATFFGATFFGATFFGATFFGATFFGATFFGAFARASSLGSLSQASLS